eukprot:6309083-Prymnesium_polylepis.1
MARVFARSTHARQIFFSALLIDIRFQCQCWELVALRAPTLNGCDGTGAYGAVECRRVWPMAEKPVGDRFNAPGTV